MKEPRMIQIENMPIDSLKGAPYNPRKMPDASMTKLMKGLTEFGMVEPIVINDRTGLIVGGHQRWEAAKRLGWDKVPVVHVDLDDTKEKALNLALNKISGEWDFPKLADLLQDLDAGEIDFELTGFDSKELERLMTWSGDEVADLDAEWSGMPEYESEDKKPFRSIIVHFEGQEQVDEFCALIGQTVTDKSRYIYHPKQIRRDYTGVAYE